MILDRAGLVGNDGPTHHGCYDLAYMGCIPNLTIMAASDEVELKKVMTCADFDDGPTVLRCPRGTGCGADKLQSLFGCIREVLFWVLTASFSDSTICSVSFECLLM